MHGHLARTSHYTFCTRDTLNPPTGSVPFILKILKINPKRSWLVSREKLVKLLKIGSLGKNDKGIHLAFEILHYISYIT